MTTEQSYVPSEDNARGRYSDGAHYQGVPEPYPGAHLDAWDRFIAQVKRDAARDARLVTLSSAGRYAIQITVRNEDEPLHLDYVDREALAQQFRELANMLTEETPDA